MSWRCHGNESLGLAVTAVFFVVHTASAASNFFGCESHEDGGQRFTFYPRQQGALSQPLCRGETQDCLGECGGQNDIILCANSAEI